jgi:hypothetical protein
MLHGRKEGVGGIVKDLAAAREGVEEKWTSEPSA